MLHRQPYWSLLAALAWAAVTACSSHSSAPANVVDPYDPGPPVLPATSDTAGWRQQAVYAVVTRSFQDSDGDGIGDYAGLISRLDYVAASGAGILLIDSPNETSFDDGARTAGDWTSVATVLGGEEAFADLVEAVHARGLRLVVTLYLNHVDRNHAWFTAATASTAVERAYFRFAAAAGTGCNDVEAGVLDPYGTTRWTFSADHGAFYFHRFSAAAPDVDWTQTAVIAEARKALTAWFERGVDGVYLADAYAWIEDVASGICDNTAASRAALNELRQTAAAYGAFVWAADHSALRGPHDNAARSAAWIGAAEAGAAADGVVVTGLGERIVEALSGEISGAYLGQLIEELAAATAVRDGVVLLPSGHWDLARASATLANDFRAYRSMMAILATSPFQPWLYYGDEIPVGNGQTTLHDNRDLASAPMPWDATAPTHGFTTGNPYLALPLDSATRNAAAASADEGGILGTWRRLLSWRYQLAPLREGDFVRAAVIDPDSGTAPAEALAWVRRSGNEAVLVVHNLGNQSKTLVVDAAATGWPAGQVRDLNNAQRPLINYSGGALPSLQLDLERTTSALLVYVDSTSNAP